MLSIRPLEHALVPVDSAAAARVSAPNYDEFQSDAEVREAIRDQPDSVLRVTMPHCDAPAPEALRPEGDSVSLERARTTLKRLAEGPLTREVSGALFVYEIDTGGAAPPQIGLGGMARTSDIRTADHPSGPILRNELVRERKAQGRARLIEATRSFIGTVNLAVPDAGGGFGATLDALVRRQPPDFEVTDPRGHTHRVRLVREQAAVEHLQASIAAQPEAYVADGNHRSAAAALLGRGGFLAVFFPASRMRIGTYNRLVRTRILAPEELDGALAPRFDVERVAPGPYDPAHPGRIGLYSAQGGWLRLRLRPGVAEPEGAVRSIDHDVVQRQLFAPVFEVADPGADDLVFVGSNRTSAWLQQEVDAGRAAYAVTLAPVTMAQFVAVCREGGMMPPKSTWFEPKIRSGLVVALVP